MPSPWPPGGQVARVGLDDVDVALDRLGAGDGVGNRIVGGQKRRGADHGADLRGLGAGDREGVAVADLIAGRVGGESEQPSRPLAAEGEIETPAGMVTIAFFSGGVAGMVRIDRRGGIGRVVGLEEMQVEPEARGLVGLDRAAGACSGVASIVVASNCSASFGLSQPVTGGAGATAVFQRLSLRSGNPSTVNLPCWVHESTIIRVTGAPA